MPKKLYSQKASPIVIENSDFGSRNDELMPNVALLEGNVRAIHEGVTVNCNKAYYYMKENYLKCFGDVNIVQGDTLTLVSKYAEYNGNAKKAFATGNVVMQSPEMQLTTDTIHFDRNKQEAYYTNNATIINKQNTLKSKSGRYFVKERKYKFDTEVVITNPENVIKTNHLDYFTTNGHAYLSGPSTITSKESFIYTENGMYDTKLDKANLDKNSYITYKDRKIYADVINYDKKRNFASGTRNVKIIDSINKAIVKGHYGEVYRDKDSLMITKMASVRYMYDKDSMFVHAKKIIVTGKAGERIIRGFNNARFYKTDMSGKCDSIHSDQKNALTKLIGKPILWNFDNQLTGDVMHLIGNNKTEKLDSLKVLKNAFIISKDTIGTGYNQVKGLNLYGKFDNNKLKEVDIVKNTETIYYVRNDKNELIGINKSVSGSIKLWLNDRVIDKIRYIQEDEGQIYPEKDLPENARKLRGFVWRGDERIKSKEEIFPPEEIEEYQKETNPKTENQKPNSVKENSQKPKVKKSQKPKVGKSKR